jgi:ATP-dependent RNA helicase DeaD
MYNWANLIVNTQVDTQADSILQELQGKFASLSKEDLLKRLITSQLDHILARNRGESNLNETQGKPGKGQAKKDTDGLHRYFVNIGAIDGVTKGDLIHFLSDISNVDRQYFSQVSMQKNYSFFYLDKKEDKGFGDKFKGIEIEGHYIRVNRDEEENKPRDKKHSKGKKKYKKDKRGSRKSRSKSW